MEAVLIDIETNGINEKLSGHRIDMLSAAYAIIDTETLVVKESDILYFWQDDFIIDQAAYEVNKLSKERLEPHKDKFLRNLAKLYKVLFKATTIGYNHAHFDIPMIKQIMVRYGFGELTVYEEEMIDVMRVTMPIYHKRLKLTKLCENLGVSDGAISMFQSIYFDTDSGFHEADYDIVATFLCYVALANKGLIRR